MSEPPFPDNATNSQVPYSKVGFKTIDQEIQLYNESSYSILTTYILQTPFTLKVEGSSTNLTFVYTYYVILPCKSILFLCTA